MQILNQPTEPTTTSYYYPLSDGRTIIMDKDGITDMFRCVEDMVYWLYNKDVPIPTIPKCVSSRIHSPNRQKWKSGSMVKSKPVFVEGGWNKEKL